jgi:phosphoglycolate phosphatase-like HAD superfamily hydrolase
MFNPESDFLALDFDGVIADSIGECLVIGHNAYVEYTRAGQQICRLEELNKTHLDECRRLRNFIRSGEDYVYINLAIDTKARIHNQQAYDSFVNRHLNLKDAFYDLFYREREFFSSTKEDLWIELNPLYPGIKQFLVQYPSKERLFLVTTKKIKYALKILAGNRIDLLKENCFCASGRDTKLKIIKNLLDKNNVSPDNFYYIDDQVDTLLEVKESGVHCLLAEWGYTTSQQISRAEKDKIPAIQLNDFLIQFSAKPEY